YVGRPELFDQSALGGSIGRAKGYASFVARPNTLVSVRCPVTWTLDGPADATSSVLVQAYDLCLDPLVRRFDARSDRHVGRLDLADFSGRWQGKLFGYESPEGDEETFLITQDGLRVSVWPPRSTTPLVSGLARDRVFVSRTIPENDGRLDEDQWTLTLKG